MVGVLSIVFAFLVSSSCVYGMNNQSELSVSKFKEVPSLKDLAAVKVFQNISNFSCDQLKEVVEKKSLYSCLPEELSTLVVQKSELKDRQFMYDITGIDFPFDTIECEPTNRSCVFFYQQNQKWVSKLSLFLCNLDEGAVVASNYEVKFEDIKYSLYGNKLLVTRSYNDYVPMQSNDQYDLLDNNLKIIKEDIFKNRNVWDVDFCCGDSMFIAEHKSNQILIDDEGNIHREARLLQCSSDGSTLLIGNFKENTRTLYDVTVEQNGTITAIFEALNVQLSATGQKLILQREDGQCVLYDLVSYEQKNISSVVSNRFYAITFNATGKIALLYNRDGSYLVDLDTLHVIEFCRSDFNIEFILGGEYIKYSDLDWGRYVIAVKDLFNNVNKETGIFQISSFLENKDLISLGWKDEPSSDLVHAINDQCDLHNNIEDLIKAFNLNGIKKEIFSKNNKTVFLFDDSRYLVSRCSDSLTIEQLALKKLIEKKLVDEDYINDNEAVKNVYDLFPDGPKRYLLELLKLQK